MGESHLERKKMKKSLITFYCFLMTSNIERIHYFVVMVTVMQFSQFFFMNLK